MALTDDRSKLDTTIDLNGQQKDYLILSQDELNKGFVRPVREKYIHNVCGSLTRMSLKIAETYARNPHFYGATFCVGCGCHFPVGNDGEFVWEDGSKVGS